MRNLKQGETVKFVFNSSTAGQSTVAISLFDANSNVRSLQTFERLVIDSAFIDGVCTLQEQGKVFLLSVPGNTALTAIQDASGNFFGSTVIAMYDGSFNQQSFIDGSANFNQVFQLPPTVVEFDGEGFSCPVGVTPSVSGASSQVVLVIGTGRIVEGKTQGVRPKWRESMVRGD